VGPRSFSLRNMEERVAQVGDGWTEMRHRRYSLLSAAARLRGT
jgi:hypothetical protein